MRSARLASRQRPAVVLVAHGSRDPRAAASTEALARAVRRARPEWTVRASYLDHDGPRPLDVLASLPETRAVLVPLLLTAAYHGRVDLPAVIREAATLPVRVTAAEVLGPASPLLLSAVCRRLPVAGLDAVVLAAAGTRDDAARQTVADAAAALGRRLGLPSAACYASGPGPRAGEAVQRLRDAGARRVGVAAYFLAPGLLYDTAAAAAREAGAVAVAEPLGVGPELVRLVAARVEAVLGGAAALIAAA
ncbi:CbiX/SirB N-terminal domain-containing protein [Actinoplanes sp. NEAU-A12]|uniref:CbiX/SirB N-terminal domain-containing protein n=1 Tax=Actinoplanes sandaracinus TaxID=3045177 RepID=A0ABT6WDS5_9ACTN|nr:CbiX/SirB N-terminal domain-containing protein [Actinoplanes sandaracinus]MDI6097888.1 CbiX/SirB N-terminal domain-containing protein [Actinoplanes sandaracinus]